MPSPEDTIGIGFADISWIDDRWRTIHCTPSYRHAQKWRGKCYVRTYWNEKHYDYGKDTGR